MWVRSPVLLSGLRIWHHHELWCRWQMQLRSRVSMTKETPLRPLAWELPCANEATIKRKKKYIHSFISSWKHLLCLLHARDHGRHKGKYESVKSRKQESQWRCMDCGKCPERDTKPMLWRSIRWKEDTCLEDQGLTFQRDPEGTSNFFFSYLRILLKQPQQFGSQFGSVSELETLSLFMALSSIIFPSTNFLLMGVSLPAQSWTWIKESLSKVTASCFSGHLVWFPQILSA